MVQKYTNDTNSENSQRMRIGSKKNMSNSNHQAAEWKKSSRWTSGANNFYQMYKFVVKIYNWYKNVQMIQAVKTNNEWELAQKNYEHFK